MKKIVCINNSRLRTLLPGEKLRSFLTKGKIYDVVEETTQSYTIYNDVGELMVYFDERFVELKEYRKLKLEKINEARNI